MEYPIVKLDRTTGQEMLPLLVQRGLFSNFSNTPLKDDLLKAECVRLGVDNLTPEQKRIVLSAAGKYRSTNYVIRDFGNYQVGFSIGNLAVSELQSSLERVTLSSLGFRIAQIILAEVYTQRKLVDLIIPKEKILAYLGYTTKEKQIYRQIDDVMFSLMHLNYFIHEYRTNVSGKIKSKEWGWFVYDVKSDSKAYTLSVNKNFVGCIEAVLNSSKNEKPDLSRGYYRFPTAILPASRSYSTPALLLTNFLLLDSGNAKLNTEKIKVVAYNTEKFMDILRINYTRPREFKTALIKVLEEVKIIQKTKPSISELKNMKTATFMSTVLHIHLTKDIEALDAAIKK